MDGWRSDEDHSVCRDSSRSQQPGNLLEVFGVLFQRNVLLRVLICKPQHWMSTGASPILHVLGSSAKFEVKGTWTEPRLLCVSLVFLPGTFQCAVIAAKEDRNSAYVVVCRALTADQSRQKDLGPPGVISRQSPVHNIALPRHNSAHPVWTGHLTCK